MSTTAANSILHLHRLEQFYLPITRSDSETRIVTGYCYTQPRVKGDKWNLKREALMRAGEKYMQNPCLRAMHNPHHASGIGTSLVWDATGAELSAEVVDDQDWRKVEKKVYRGFSIGGRPIIARGNDVEEFDWVETSLVDRPADTGALFAPLSRVEDGIIDYDMIILPDDAPDALVEQIILARATVPDIAEQVARIFGSVSANIPIDLSGGNTQQALTETNLSGVNDNGHQSGGHTGRELVNHGRSGEQERVTDSGTAVGVGRSDDSAAELDSVKGSIGERAQAAAGAVGTVAENGIAELGPVSEATRSGRVRFDGAEGTGSAERNPETEPAAGAGDRNGDAVTASIGEPERRDNDSDAGLHSADESLRPLAITETVSDNSKSQTLGFSDTGNAADLASDNESERLALSGELERINDYHASQARDERGRFAGGLGTRDTKSGENKSEGKPDEHKDGEKSDSKDGDKKDGDNKGDHSDHASAASGHLNDAAAHAKNGDHDKAHDALAKAKERLELAKGALPDKHALKEGYSLGGEAVEKLEKGDIVGAVGDAHEASSLAKEHMDHASEHAEHDAHDANEHEKKKAEHESKGENEHGKKKKAPDATHRGDGDIDMSRADLGSRVLNALFGKDLRRREWNESEHPRAHDGKFGSGGGTATETDHSKTKAGLQKALASASSMVRYGAHTPQHVSNADESTSTYNLAFDHTHDLMHHLGELVDNIPDDSNDAVHKHILDAYRHSAKASQALLGKTKIVPKSDHAKDHAKHVENAKKSLANAIHEVSGNTDRADTYLELERAGASINWNESQHPRASDGKFGHGGGSIASTGKEHSAQKHDVDHTATGARVGVPAMEVPPPPGIRTLPNLTPRERKVERQFISAFEKAPDRLAGNFREMCRASGEPPTFGTDDAKQLTSVWSGKPSASNEKRAENRATLNLALHQTANAIAKRAFVQHLDTLKPGDEVMVTVGGCGAGKGFALKNVPDALAIKNRCSAIWDSAGDQNASENPWILSEAKRRDLKVTYVYVHADPYTQWSHPERGVVKRAGDPADGRMVDAHVFADSYAIGAKNHAEFHAKHKDDRNVNFIFLENGAKPKQIDGVPADALNLDAKALREFAIAEIAKSDAPKHVKEGGTMGNRIWGDGTVDRSDAIGLINRSNDDDVKSDDAQSKWWKEDAERANRMGDIASDSGFIIDIDTGDGDDDGGDDKPTERADINNEVARALFGAEMASGGKGAPGQEKAPQGLLERKETALPGGIMETKSVNRAAQLNGDIAGALIGGNMKPRNNTAKWLNPDGAIDAGYAKSVMYSEGITDPKHQTEIVQGIERGTHKTPEDVIKHIDRMHVNIARSDMARTNSKAMLLTPDDYAHEMNLAYGRLSRALGNDIISEITGVGGMTYVEMRDAAKQHGDSFMPSLLRSELGIDTIEEISEFGDVGLWRAGAWDESQHPRAKDGKFGSGGSGGSDKSSSVKSSSDGLMTSDEMRAYEKKNDPNKNSSTSYEDSEKEWQEYLRYNKSVQKETHERMSSAIKNNNPLSKDEVATVKSVVGKYLTHMHEGGGENRDGDLTNAGRVLDQIDIHGGVHPAFHGWVSDVIDSHITKSKRDTQSYGHGMSDGGYTVPFEAIKAKLDKAGVKRGMASDDVPVRENLAGGSTKTVPGPGDKDGDKKNTTELHDALDSLVQSLHNKIDSGDLTSSDLTSIRSLINRGDTAIPGSLSRLQQLETVEADHAKLLQRHDEVVGRMTEVTGELARVQTDLEATKNGLSDAERKVAERDKEIGQLRDVKLERKQAAMFTSGIPVDRTFAANNQLTSESVQRAQAVDTLHKSISEATEKAQKEPDPEKRDALTRDIMLKQIQLKGLVGGRQ